MSHKRHLGIHLPGSADESPRITTSCRRKPRHVSPDVHPNLPIDRRCFHALVLKALLMFPLGMAAARATGATPRDAASIQALKEAAATEWRAHRRYVAYARRAKLDGYDGIAYLFTALAISELIHAQNYNRLLAMSGEEILEMESTQVPVTTTKDNVIDAANKELNSIENVYPDILQHVTAAGSEEAVLTVRYAWESHSQHLDIINKIRQWSPTHFEIVARRIDKTTERYFICQICGSTVKKIPQTTCPICANPARYYRPIDPDLFA